MRWFDSTGDEQSKRVVRVLKKSFMISFILFETVSLLLTGFTYNLILATILSLAAAIFLAILIAVAYRAARRGSQIGEIIEAKHKEIREKKREDKSRS